MAAGVGALCKCFIIVIGVRCMMWHGRAQGRAWYWYEVVVLAKVVACVPPADLCLVIALYLCCPLTCPAAVKS
jgi:hypothetical protein